MDESRAWHHRVFSRMNPPVFLGAAALVIGFVLFGTLFTEAAHRLFDGLHRWIVAHFGWFYVLTTTGLLVFVLYLIFGRFGRIKLGGEETEPEFHYLSWFAMLFSAGMGIGLVFFGVAEPVKHYLNPPAGGAQDAAALSEAMRLTFFHWGFHPWAIYAVFGLGIAYFHFRFGLPLAPRSILYPLIGERFRGWMGHAVDILCTVGTLFGVATSLGLGAMQVNTGVSLYADIPQDTGVQITIIALITVVATLSVVSGIHRGIRRLSQTNLALAALLLGFVFLAGPSQFIMELFTDTLGEYLQSLVASSLWVQYEPGATWQEQWTLFYWGWWISWSPFVGIFTARISRGRTVREYVATVLLVPSGVTFLWLSVFGGTGLHLELYGAGGVAERVQEDVAYSLHALFHSLPFSAVTLLLATLLVIIFFITSSDSGSLVDDMVTSGGHPHPPKSQRVFWAVSEGAVAATLLLAGGLRALQAASLTSGLPMAVLLILMAFGIFRALRADVDTEGPPDLRELRPGGARARRD